MKRSAIYVCLILGFAAAISWKTRGDLIRMRTENARLGRSLELKAEQEMAARKAGARETGPRISTTNPVDGAAIAGKLLAFLRRQEPAAQKDFERHPETEDTLSNWREETALRRELNRLDQREMEKFMACLEEDSVTPANLYFSALRFLGMSNPGETLNWCADPEHDPAPFALAEWVDAELLRNAAGDDPSVMERWAGSGLMDRAGIPPGMMQEALVAAIGRRNPAQALSMIAAAPADERSSMIPGLIEVSRAPSQRMDLLGAIRKFAAESPPEEGREITNGAFANLAQDSIKEGYERSAGWLASAQFTPEEAIAFASGINNWQLDEDRDKWMDWLHRQDVPLEKKIELNTSLLKNWADTDMQAARNWTLNLPAGPEREAYARTLIGQLWIQVPAQAAALYPLLPDTPDRAEIRRIISARLEDFDPAAAAKFEKENP